MHLLHCTTRLVAHIQRMRCVQKDALRSPSIKVDRFFSDEERLWKELKGTSYYASLGACANGIVPMPFRHWVRFMLHVPSTYTIEDLIRIFDEEDTVTIMAMVRN